MVFQIIDGKLLLYVDPNVLTDEQWALLYETAMSVEYHKKRAENLP